MIRTRFAPSPTGFLHVGGVRTALFAWLLARQAKGHFILRIEDTDRTRHVEESEQHIMECLKWLGLEWDDGPYRQSQRLDLYKEWGKKLVQAGRAFADPYSAQELEELRTGAVNAHQPFLYRDYRPKNPTSWDGSQPLRFKSEPKAYSWRDEVMGKLKSVPEAIDDFILIKSDGFPTYNFAHIIDDHLMKVSHVIRSQEFLPSVPKYLNLYEALAIERPKLATLPYVLAPDGQTKLSKRHGAKDILDYRREGYLPEALINFLATLGWHDGTNQEIFSIDELIEKFSLERVQRGGAKIDEKRLDWINGHYVRQKPIDELYELSKDFWPSSAKNQTVDYKKSVLTVVQERLKHCSELSALTNFFFEDLAIDLSLIDDNKQLSSLGRHKQTSLLEAAIEKLAQGDFKPKDLADKLNNLLSETGQPPAVLFSLIRIATTWAPASPGLAETLSLLGRDRTIERLQKSIAALNSGP
ncbi:MAG TPA: glutamate--tRNA ligase [Candidatus Saccharimonadales bacterium]